ncbi:PGSIP2 [Arabidopsis thaliana]|uniref:Hexosyltransferase n=1 Tax=Arabidopsis thaliana TaxID=3702 RepID=A0A178WC26_ARATH|nr:PGSIP2 [Arabidopsis thaliana]
MKLSSESPMAPSSQSSHRLYISSEKTKTKRFQRNGYTLDVEMCVNFSSLKLVLFLMMLVAMFTLYCSPPLQIPEDPSSFANKWILEPAVTTDPRYIATSEINWNSMSLVVEHYLSGRSEYQGIGFLNLNDNEINRWQVVIKSHCQHIALHLDHAASNITWKSLYPEWIDEEEKFKVPTCPSLPWIQVPDKSRIDLIIAKLPCNKSGKWSRDVARLHLQLAAARVAASSEGLHDVHVILVSDCFPIPNLFTGQELVARQGNIWLYKPKLHQLRQKLQLPVGSCELSVPLQAKDNFYSANAKKEAYATILHSDDAFVCGAIAVAQSIRMSGSTRNLVILVDDSISEYHRSGLESAGWKIHTFQRIRNPKAEANAYNQWNYSKFRLWQLTEYNKIIFIDADMLILRNMDFLFEYPEISTTGNDGTLFNSGLMVIEPSNSTFQLLMDHINDINSYNGGDQGYLNEIFTWWHRIPKHMNFLKHFWEGDTPKHRKSKTRLFGADPPILYVLHYLGYNKPWVCFRDYDCNWNVVGYHQFASDEAHKTWWRVHDAMPKKLQRFCLLSSKQKAQLEWDRRQAEKANYRDGHWRIKIKDKRLTTCFEDFCFWESMLWHWGETQTNSTVAADSSSTA